MSDLRELIEALKVRNVTAAGLLDRIETDLSRGLRSDALNHLAFIDKLLVAAEAQAPLAQAEAAVVEAAIVLTKTAHDMGVIDPVSHIAVAMDLCKYAAKEQVLFNACAALDRARKEGE